jgi:hypothetical protein
MAASDVAQAWGNWIADMGEWHVFGALTYAQQNRTTVPGSDVAKAHVRRWLGESQKTVGRPIEAAVVALEYQRNGWPHFHPLLRMPGGLRPYDLARLGQAWYRLHGYAKLEVPRSAPDVCAYAAKYLSKDLSRGDVIFWPARGSLSTHQPQLLRRSRSGKRGQGLA